MLITKLSALADSFPDTEVEYVDMLGLPYLVDGRFGDRGINCLGVALEIFRRAGLAFPDPKTAGASVFAFVDLFEKVQDADHLYDLINVRRSSNHVAIVVRQGVALSVHDKAGVHTARVKALKAVSGAECFRVKASCLPT